MLSSYAYARGDAATVSPARWPSGTAVTHVPGLPKLGYGPNHVPAYQPYAAPGYTANDAPGYMATATNRECTM